VAIVVSVSSAAHGEDPDRPTQTGVSGHDRLRLPILR
jgi:hypothetical protein